MTPTIQEFQFEEITPKGMDSIQVYWRNIGPAQGSVVITCYGCAWTAYWGGMGDRTIRSFFTAADADYLVDKLSRPSACPKRETVYLARIVSAIKSHLLSEVPTE